MEFKIKHNNNNKIRNLFIIFIVQHLLWIVSGNLTTLNDTTEEDEDNILIDCDEADCLKCTSIYGCIRCSNLITYDDRRCVNECPRGYIEQWSTVPELMGRVCRSNGYSDPILATIVGLAIGATVCIILVVLGIVMIKRKQRQRHMSEQLIDDTIEREDFLKQLNELRPNAEYYLAMLNDLRRTIRKLYLSGDINGANYYRPIIRDLSKILILINRPVELLHRPPHDWNHVYVWGLRIIERYKPHITQLIDFLQNSSTDQQQHQQSLSHILDPRIDGGGGNGNVGTGSGSSKYSTFKSTNTTRTELNDNNSNSNNNNSNNNQNQNSINNGKDMVDLYQMKIFGSMINLHDNDTHSQTPSKNPFRNSLHTLSKGSPSSSSDIHGSSLWLENEFFKLGFRPQDEITTEL